MKVLLLNTYPRGGGAAVAVRRAQEALERAGMEVRVLWGTDFGLRHKAAFFAERADVFHAVHYNRSQLFRFSTASRGVDIAHHPWVEWAEIIHIHWVQQGFLSLRGLQRLLSLQGKRFFWTLHDLWALTGGCHIPYVIGQDGQTSFCEAFRSHCGHCPLLGSRKMQDRSFRVFDQKAQLPLHKVHVVGVSHALATYARHAKLFAESRVTALPNPIDLDRFKPQPPSSPTIERKLLFVAARADDPVKGLDLCRAMLRHAVRHSEYFEREAHLYIVGEVKEHAALEGFPIRVTHLGRLEQAQLIQLYQEATLLLCTSRFESLVTTLVEGIACGVPAVAFEVGGMADIIQPEQGNGALIAPYDLEAMALAVVEWSELQRPRAPFAIAATVQHFAQEIVGQKLVQLYLDTPQ